MKVLGYKKNGFALMDALISLLIFSFGIVGLALFQGVILARDKDNDFRINATLLAENIIGMASAEPNNAPCYVLNTNAAGTCNSSTAQAAAVSWQTDVAAKLPGAIAPIVQYVPEIFGTGGQIIVTLKWKRGNDNTTHNLVQTSQVGA